MRVISLEETRLTLQELAELAEDEPVIVTRNGQPFLSIRELSEEDREDASLMASPAFLRLIEESRRQHREHGGVGLDAMRQDLGA